MSLVLVAAVVFSSAATVVALVTALRIRTLVPAAVLPAAAGTAWGATYVDLEIATPPWPLEVAALCAGAGCLAIATLLAMSLLQRNEARRRGDELLQELTRNMNETSSQLESGEIRMRQLTGVIPVGIFEADLDGNVLHMSTRAREITGLEKPATKGDRWIEAAHEDDRPAIRECIQHAVANREPFDVQCRFARDADEVVWVSLHAQLQHDGAENPIGYVGYVADVTERRLAEETHARLEDRLRQTQKLESLAVLAGGIAHDFNNLLVGILGNAGLALADLEEESEVRVAVQQIEAAALRAAALTEKMLAYSGKGWLVVEPVNLNQFIEDSAHLLGITVAKGVRLEYDLDRSIPCVEVDPAQLRQVIVNLVINASESYCERGGPVAIRTSLVDAKRRDLENAFAYEELPEGWYVVLEVKDEGCGMDAATQERLFDPFFTTKFTGRGLGLAATLGIVRGHRGAIQVESAPGEGTSVRVLLAAADPAAAPRSNPPESEHTHGGDGHTVLIVDDEDIVRNMAARILRQRGFEVVEARDGAEAVQMYRDRSEEISVVLLDMVMPEMTGSQVFSKLRQVRAGVRVLLTSGYSESYAKDGFGEDDLAGFIQKPYRPSQLVEKIREVLQV
ncbi:MAG: hypothetical protein CMJ83_02265 [Planctomycetes bacterium]|nr:hypothetical protein [Planctomycetota bacterium]